MRLRHYKPFWIETAAMFLFGVFFLYLAKSGDSTLGSLDAIFFRYTTAIGGFSAVFIGLFLGTEYSDGTYKNKVVVGHSKAAIYFSNLIVGFVEGLILIFAWTLSMAAIGIPLMGGFTSSPGMIISYLLSSICMTGAYVSIFTLLCMLNHNKAGAAVSALLVFMLILALGSYCMVSLAEPELYSPGPTYSVVDADTQTITETSSLEPNPAYLTGNKRKFFEFAGDFLPSAQGIQLSIMRGDNLLLMSAYSLLIVIGTTTLGILCFRKKDLK
jgi:hypothetical protein